MDFSAVLRDPKPETLNPAQAPSLPHWDTIPMDLEAVKGALAPYQVQVAEMVKAAGELKIADDASQTRAVELGTTAKKIKKAVEAIKQSPNYLEADQFVKDVRNLLKTFTDPLDLQVEKPLKAKLTAYADQLRLEAQRRDAAAREAARKLQEQADEKARKLREEAEAKAKEAEKKLAKEKDEAARAALQRTIDEETEAAKNIVAPQVVAPVVEPVHNTVRTGAGSAYGRTTWEFEITDEAQVPREYLAVNEQKIRQAVKAGIRQVAGVRIYEKTSTSFR